MNTQREGETLEHGPTLEERVDRYFDFLNSNDLEGAANYLSSLSDADRHIVQELCSSPENYAVEHAEAIAHRKQLLAMLPPEPDDYDDPQQLERYLTALRKLFGEERTTMS